MSCSWEFSPYPVNKELLEASLEGCRKTRVAFFPSLGPGPMSTDTKGQQGAL